MTSPRQPACYGYCRATTEHQARAGLRLERQRELIVEHHAQHLKHSHVWGGLFADDVASGRVPRLRTAGAQLFAALEAGDAVIFPALARAFCSAADIRASTRLLRARGVRPVLLELPAGGQEIPEAVLAEFDRARRSERSHLDKRAAQREGRYLGGRPPYGMKVDRRSRRGLVPDERERAVGRKIVECRQAGCTWHGTYFNLLRHRIKNKEGRDYSVAQIQRHFQNELRAVAAQNPVAV